MNVYKVDMNGTVGTGHPRYPIASQIGHILKKAQIKTISKDWWLLMKQNG